MISRNKQTVNEVLFSKSLCTSPPENEAAKIFVQWLHEHPEYSVDDVDMRIDCHETEEDHYGNGGGYHYSLRIVKCRVETSDEYTMRIREEEGKVFADFTGRVRSAATELIRELKIYLVSNEITEKIEEIVNGAMKVASDSTQELRERSFKNNL